MALEFSIEISYFQDHHTPQGIFGLVPHQIFLKEMDNLTRLFYIHQDQVFTNNISFIFLI